MALWIVPHYTTFKPMNFLAHIHLSGNDKDLRFGNFIADAVRGKAYQEFPLSIQRGILLHRKIDHYTDNHPTFRQHCRLLYADHGHYARVIMDVLYDHLLAKHWANFHPQHLEDFAETFFTEIEAQQELLPEKMHGLFQTMKKQNWLVQYKTIEGLTHILYHMSKRTAFPSNFTTAVDILDDHSTDLLTEFTSFYTDLQVATQIELETLNQID